MSIELCQSNASASRNVGEDTALGGFLDERRIRRMEQDDHRAGGLLHDLLDQAERMLGALAESDERDVRPLPGGDRPDVLDLDLACDHLVTESDDNRHDQLQAILPLVRDQNA